MNILAASRALLGSEAFSCPLTRRSYLPRPTDFSGCWLVNDFLASAFMKIALNIMQINFQAYNILMENKLVGLAIGFI